VRFSLFILLPFLFVACLDPFGAIDFEGDFEGIDGHQNNLPVPLITNETEEGYDGWYGYITGVVEYDGIVRVYYEDRTDGTHIYYIESSDLENWSFPRPVQFEGSITVFYHNGWKAYSGSGGSMVLYTSDDGVHFDEVGEAFRWKTDSVYSSFWDGEKYVMYGRVRGDNAGRGGWQNNSIDRRGISFHSNPEWSANWENAGKNIADPMDYWDYSGQVRPDFYAPNILPDGTGFTTVFWKDTTRVPEARPNQFTGPVYPIYTKIENETEFKIVSEESVIPLDYHERISSHPNSSSSEKEVGQIYIFPAIVRGHVFYHHRGDTHYEFYEYQHSSGIYMYELDS
jgi:hypothetical protein